MTSSSTMPGWSNQTFCKSVYRKTRNEGSDEARTNNGVIYVLDKVLENKSAASPTTPDETSGTGSAPSGTSTKSLAVRSHDMGIGLLAVPLFVVACDVGRNLGYLLVW